MRVEMLDVVVSIAAGVASISVSGEIDPFSAPKLQNVIYEALLPDVREVSLDLSDVSFIDARGYDSIVETGAAVRESGRELGISHRSLSVIRIEQLMASLDRYPTEQALRGLGA